jgi:hypothetical protein
MSAEAEKSLSRGVQWLISQQGADGGWHSTTYGQLKDGPAVTSLIVDALGHLNANDQPQYRAAINKGFAFLDRGLARRGTVASPDGSLDFPTYAAALYLTGKRRLGMPIGGEQRRQLLDYLLGAQLVEGRGFEPQSPSYGGWDFLGKGDAQGITTGTSISVARYVLEALAQEPGVGKAIALGQEYVLRCQRPGGGFAFTCEPMSLNNKAAYADEKLTEPRPYGTATCDGILALLACGLAPDDERIAKAIAWLVKRPAVALVPGFEGLPPEAGWQRGLRFYYYAGLTRVLPHFPAADIASRCAALVQQLVGEQKANGSWINESDRMRENDPLIATALAAVALANCQAD